MGGKGSGLGGGRKRGSARGRTKLAPAAIQIADKQAQALRLRIAGATFASIAESLGYSAPQGAYEAVKAALDKTLREPADELRKIDLERLERMLLGIWPAAIAGHHGAIDRAIRLLERRARLLGLDAPTKLVGGDGGPVTLRVVYDLPKEVQGELTDGQANGES